MPVIYGILFKQYTIIGAIKNACGLGNKGRIDVNNIRMNLRKKEYIDSFREKNLHLVDKREKLTFLLVKIRAIGLAVFAARFYYSIRNRGI